MTVASLVREFTLVVVDDEGVGFSNLFSTIINDSFAEIVLPSIESTPSAVGYTSSRGGVPTSHTLMTVHGTEHGHWGVWIETREVHTPETKTAAAKLVTAASLRSLADECEAVGRRVAEDEWGAVHANGLN